MEGASQTKPGYWIGQPPEVYVAVLATLHKVNIGSALFIGDNLLVSWFVVIQTGGSWFHEWEVVLCELISWELISREDTEYF